MSSIVVLTPEIREIPYFSAFSINDETIVVPRSFIYETINFNKENLETVDFNELVTIIDNLIYLGMSTKDLIDELVWRVGETMETLYNVSNLPTSVQRELRPYLLGDGFKYGVRCGIIPNNSRYVCSTAAYVGNLRLLKWLYSKGCPLNEWVCTWAASNGDIDALKWARENGCPWDENTCCNAAENGRLDILKYLYENGCPWDHVTCSWAAKNGHLETLKYAHENGCPWNNTVCLNAARTGQLEVVKYLHENGCPWDGSVYEAAVMNGHLEVSEYVKKNGCPTV